MVTTTFANGFKYKVKRPSGDPVAPWDTTVNINTVLQGGNPGNYGTDSVTVVWGDGQPDTPISGPNQSIIHNYTDPNGEYEITIYGNYTIAAFSGNDKIISIENWGDVEFLNAVYHNPALPNPSLQLKTSLRFDNCVNLITDNSPTGPKFNINSDILIRSTFLGCTNFNPTSLNHWNVEFVTHMDSMFENCTNFNGDITEWNTSNCESMSRMFRNASSFNQPICKWNVSSLQVSLGALAPFSKIFEGASSFCQNLIYWNNTNITTGPSQTADWNLNANSCWTTRDHWAPAFLSSGGPEDNPPGNVIPGYNAPPSGIGFGSIGDFWIDIINDTIYKKDVSGWTIGTTVSGVNNWIFCSISAPCDQPKSGDGVQGDYFVNVYGSPEIEFYGPKGVTDWPVSSSGNLNDLMVVTLPIIQRYLTIPSTTAVIRTNYTQGSQTAREDILANTNVIDSIDTGGYNITGLTGSVMLTDPTPWSMYARQVTLGSDYRLALNYYAPGIPAQQDYTVKVSFETDQPAILELHVTFTVDNAPTFPGNQYIFKNFGAVSNASAYTSDDPVLITEPGTVPNSDTELLLNGETIATITFDLYTSSNVLVDNTIKTNSGIIIDFNDGMKLKIPTPSILPVGNYTIKNLVITDTDTDVLDINGDDFELMFNYTSLPTVAPTAASEIKFFSTIYIGNGTLIANYVLKSLNDNYVRTLINQSNYIIGDITVNGVNKISSFTPQDITEVDEISERTLGVANTFTYTPGNNELQINGLTLGNYSIQFDVDYIGTMTWPLSFEAILQVSARNKLILNFGILDITSTTSDIVQGESNSVISDLLAGTVTKQEAIDSLITTVTTSQNYQNLTQNTKDRVLTLLDTLVISLVNSASKDFINTSKTIQGISVRLTK